MVSYSFVNSFWFQHKKKAQRRAEFAITNKWLNAQKIIERTVVAMVEGAAYKCFPAFRKNYYNQGSLEHAFYGSTDNWNAAYCT